MPKRIALTFYWCKVPPAGQQTHPRPVLDVADVELHGDVEAVQEVPSKHHGVDGGVDGVDPTWERMRTAHVTNWFNSHSHRYRHSITERGAGVSHTHLRGWWGCSPASAQSFGSRSPGRPGRRLPVSLTAPSSRTAPGSEEWAGSARIPLGKEQNGSLQWQERKSNLQLTPSRQRLTGRRAAPTLVPLRMWYHTDVPPKSMWKSV